MYVDKTDLMLCQLCLNTLQKGKKKQEMLFFILHCVRASWIPSCFIAPKLVTFNRSYRSSQLQSYFMSVIESYFMSVKSAFKGTVMEIKKALVNDRLRVSKVPWKLCIPTIPWNLLFSLKVAYSFYCLFCLWTKLYGSIIWKLERLWMRKC